MPPSTSLISREGPCCSTSAWVFRRWSISGTICKPSTARTRPASRRTSSTRGGASPVEGLIAIVGLESHPEGGKQGAYDRISFFDPAGLASGAPVVSVDCEKKEAVGRFANGGREWRPAGEPTEVLGHDLSLPGLGKVVPYGARNVGADEGWVSVGMSRDTAHLTVASPRSWWDQMGSERCAGTARLLPACDGGGSNGSRDRLRERELQLFCDRNRMEAGPATCLPAPQSGTRSSTTSSPRSPATGAAGLQGRLR